jgi:hypothetical protein
MKKIITLALTVGILFLSGCTTKQQSNVISVTGEFKSVAGIMDNLSCYCGSGGYITTKDDERVPICFKGGLKINCTNITVNGFYESKKINPGKMSQCPAGEMKYLKASSYNCN